MSLKDAIKTGKSDWKPDVVCQDNQCEFGKWLYACNSQEQSSPHYGKVKQLHAEFHKTAAKVLALALDGKKGDAEKAISEDSDYKTISANLTREMTSWKSDVS
jgi:hypothetical protein